MSYNLQNLQSLRLIAALLVFVQHSVYFSGLATNTQITRFLSFNFGDIGVFVFFVISGFVIAMQTDRKPLQFMLHRIFRIYPGYIAAVLFSAGVLFLFSDYRPDLNDTSMSILLIPTGSLNPSLQVPYWTLIYEMFFYALVLALMTVFRGRAAIIDGAIFAWLLVMIYQTANGVSFSVAMPTVSEIAFSPLNIYFIVGFFLSRILLSKSPQIGYMALFISASSSIFFYGMKAPVAVCALTIAAIIWAIKSPTLPKVMNTLGDYSYGIYLVHTAVIYCIYLEVQKNGGTLYTSVALMAIAALPVAVLFGKLEHWVYKYKIRPGIDNLLRRAKPSPAPLQTL
ncbi:acyltransferase family protein [Pseudomonas sp. G3-19]